MKDTNEAQVLFEDMKPNVEPILNFNDASPTHVSIVFACYKMKKLINE
jgi:hypothetical protein